MRFDGTIIYYSILHRVTTLRNGALYPNPSQGLARGTSLRVGNGLGSEDGWKHDMLGEEGKKRGLQLARLLSQKRLGTETNNFRNNSFR